MISPDIVAIDCHVHLNDAVTREANAHRTKQMDAHFRRETAPVDVDRMADMFRSRKMMAVIMNTTDISTTGHPGVPNDHIAEVVAAHPDVFLGFGVVDPRQGAVAEREMRRCKELGLAGIGELNPARQHFKPNDPQFGALWSTAADLGLPVLFHGGYAAAGAGLPGGMGVRLGYSRPIYLDDVAAEFPTLTIICAHPSWPWESEALAVAMHKGNVYLDLSGWAPKYLSGEVRRYVNSRIPDKVLFGSDWPGISVDRWLDEFAELDLKEESRRKILLQNAVRLLRLSNGDSAPGGTGVADV